MVDISSTCCSGKELSQTGTLTSLALRVLLAMSLSKWPVEANLSQRPRWGAFLTLRRPFDKLRERLGVPGQWGVIM